MTSRRLKLILASCSEIDSGLNLTWKNNQGAPWWPHIVSWTRFDNFIVQLMGLPDLPTLDWNICEHSGQAHYISDLNVDSQILYTALLYPNLTLTVACAILRTQRLPTGLVHWWCTSLIIELLRTSFTVIAKISDLSWPQKHHRIKVMQDQLETLSWFLCPSACQHYVLKWKRVKVSSFCMANFTSCLLCSRTDSSWRCAAGDAPSRCWLQLLAIHSISENWPQAW